MDYDYGFEPMNDWVLALPEPAETVIAGMAIADDAQKKPQKALVVAVGPGRLDEKLGAEVGDELFFQQHGTIPMNLKDTDLLLINRQQMLGRFLK